MRHSLCSIVIVILFSCGQGKSNKNQSESKTDGNLKIMPVDTTVINKVLIDYYTGEFQKTKSDEPQSQLKIDTTESGIELKIIIDPAYSSGPLNTIPFSSKYIKGDLNNDKVDDIVVPVYSTGGGSEDWFEIFIFVSLNGKLDFFKMYTSYELGNCDSTVSLGGEFFPISIKNGILIGESYCWVRNDPHCCPSLNYKTKLKFNNGFVLLNQTKKD